MIITHPQIATANQEVREGFEYEFQEHPYNGPASSSAVKVISAIQLTETAHQIKLKVISSESKYFPKDFVFLAHTYGQHTGYTGTNSWLLLDKPKNPLQDENSTI